MISNTTASPVVVLIHCFVLGFSARARIECGGIKTDEDLTERLKELTDLRDELNQNSPQIPRWAYEKAKRGIKAGEADYKVDEYN